MKKTPVKKGSKMSTVKPLKGNLGKLSKIYHSRSRN